MKPVAETFLVAHDQQIDGHTYTPPTIDSDCRLPVSEVLNM